jgi:hypothetical protein
MYYLGVEGNPFYVTGSMAVCAMEDSSTTESIVPLRILNVVAGQETVSNALKILSTTPSIPTNQI